VTITVDGAADSETKQRLNQAIIAILKPWGSNWRVGFGTIGERRFFKSARLPAPKR
jgi:hypothetical protein